MERWLPSPRPKSFAASRSPIPSRSIRTSGSISLWTAAACSIAIRGRRAPPSPTAAITRASLSQDPVEGFAFFEESLELSRRFRALKIWLSLRYHGLNAFRDAIRADLDHAQQLAALVRANDKLELLAPVELSAVCFRYVGAGLSGEAVERIECRHPEARHSARARVHFQRGHPRQVCVARLLRQSPHQRRRTCRRWSRK